MEFFETTAHGGARPTHAEWQGRQFHRGGAVDYLGRHYPDFESSTGYGTGGGLCGWNCRHTFFAVFPELGAPPAWTQESLEALNARDIEYDGGKYTAYEISQMQRVKERTVRKYKRRYLAEDAAGADTTDSAVKLRQARQELADFISATGSRADSSRTSVAGFGRSASNKASWAAKKANALHEPLNMEPQPVTMKSISSVKAFTCETLDRSGQLRLQNAHKQLLIAAAKQPPGIEVGKVLDLNMKSLTDYVIGSDKGHSVQLPDFNVSYIVIHTHPACGVLSHGDLSNFVDCENLKLMTAIGNNGHIYAVEKSTIYDSNKASGIVWKLNAEIDRLKNTPRAELPNEQLLEQAEAFVWKAIKELEESGVKFYE